MSTKADAGDFLGRFREIVSDPLNLFVRRSANAGFTDGSLVYLHNGLRVPISGTYSYYGDFSDILVINRGVHEPLEEFIFQEVLKFMPRAPVMLELGAYWGHYSMWLKNCRPDAEVHLVEPDPDNLQVGIENFELNGLSGHFIEAFVGNGKFAVDAYLRELSIPKLDILHTDIQGYEVEMLQACTESLSKCRIDFVFLSTHSQQLHRDCVALLTASNYRVEVEADFENGTTSYDGFILASSPLLAGAFDGFTPLTRAQISCAQPAVLCEYISKVIMFLGKRDQLSTDVVPGGIAWQR
jgi:hypothetical protein